jgi:hypothetical protein
LAVSEEQKGTVIPQFSSLIPAPNL